MGAPATTFDDLVTRHGDGVRRVCRSILRDDHLCEDALQQIFLRLWERWKLGRAPEQVGAWLARVAVTVSIDLLRRRTSADLRPLGEDEAAIVPAKSPSAGLERSELLQRFERALDELPEGQRTVFVLRHEGGLSLAEVARTLGVAHATAKTQFARACLKLQRRLAPHRPTEGPSS